MAKKESAEQSKKVKMDCALTNQDEGKWKKQKESNKREWHQMGPTFKYAKAWKNRGNMVKTLEEGVFEPYEASKKHHPEFWPIEQQSEHDKKKNALSQNTLKRAFMWK